MDDHIDSRLTDDAANAANAAALAVERKQLIALLTDWMGSPPDENLGWSEFIELNWRGRCYIEVCLRAVSGKQPWAMIRLKGEWLLAQTSADTATEAVRLALSGLAVEAADRVKRLNEIMERALNFAAAINRG